MRVSKPRKPVQVQCIDCGCTFTALSRKALRCEKCNILHKQNAWHQNKERARVRRAMKNIYVPSMTIAEVVRATAEYNKIHGTLISEGMYVSLMERGLLDAGEQNRGNTL